MHIAIAGGTGTVGRYVVEAAREAGHTTRVLSRSAGVDLVSGSGLAEALAGADAIVDAANINTMRAKPATKFFRTTTRALQDRGVAAGVTRLLTISIVNIDRVQANGYYRAKLAQEAAALEGPVPSTILRATQFHEFPAQVMERARFGPVVLVPHMRVQTVAARSVGQTAIELLALPPEQTIVDVAGPGVADVVDLARQVIRRTGSGAKVLPVAIPGRWGRWMRDGSLTPGPGARIVGPSFEEWLAGDDIKSVVA
jgi:uncharacterized protein YbjT (DUF2867 family)